MKIILNLLPSVIQENLTKIFFSRLFLEVQNIRIYEKSTATQDSGETDTNVAREIQRFDERDGICFTASSLPHSTASDGRRILRHDRTDDMANIGDTARSNLIEATKVITIILLCGARRKGLLPFFATISRIIWFFLLLLFLVS